VSVKIQFLDHRNATIRDENSREPYTLSLGILGLVMNVMKAQVKAGVYNLRLTAESEEGKSVDNIRITVDSGAEKGQEQVRSLTYCSRGELCRRLYKSCEERIAMMAIQSYRELIAWQKAMDLVEAIYRATTRFPREEIYSLTAQIRRAAISIPSNIAEGQGRSTTRDLLHFLSIAQGSFKEVETQVLIAERLAYVTEQIAAHLLEQTTEVGRLVSGLSNSLKKRIR
jgi:four helix bundle protein